MDNDLLNNDKLVNEIYNSDVIERAKLYQNMGSYTHSKGFSHVRKTIAKYIENRDKLVANSIDPETIFLGNGASSLVTQMMQLLIRNDNDGIMIPIPQYPLYSALLELYNGKQVSYYLDENKSWGFDIAQLEQAMEDANKKNIDVRGIVVINPGNPTGQVLNRDNMEEIIEFAAKHNIVILADEVYQENIYDTTPFISFRKLINESKYKKKLQLASFHSVSKGFLGECGIRGGYMELYNIDKQVQEEIYKLSSISLCSNSIGQAMVQLMLDPPNEDEPSYPLYIKERNDILESLKRKAKYLHETLNELDGITCNPAQGAMYLFPRIHFSEKAIEQAKKQGMEPDYMYAMELLDATGIVVVPGAGFGQYPGTYHFRTTFLQPEEDMEKTMLIFKKFHNNFMKKYT